MTDIAELQFNAKDIVERVQMTAPTDVGCCVFFFDRRDVGGTAFAMNAPRRQVAAVVSAFLKNLERGDGAGVIEVPELTAVPEE